MKYTVINHTTIEKIETDNLATAYEWVYVWVGMEHNIELDDNISGEVIFDTRRED